MQSKIIFVILFMLTFTVVHDTIINVIDTTDNMAISHYTEENIKSQECDSIDEIHSMFHFVALIAPYKNSFIQLPIDITLTDISLQYTPPYREPSYKPPKV